MKTNLCKLFILAIVLFTAGTLNAQNTFPATGSAGIGTATPNASSILEVKSTTKGLLLPRMTTAQKSAIVTPVAGLLIYQTDNTKGLYHYTGSAWKAVAPAAWNLAGNGATTASQFLGTTDSTGLKIRTKNIQRAVFDAQGNLGIGNTNPGERLEVTGKVLLTNGFNSTSGALCYKSNTDYLFIGPRSGGSGDGGAMLLFGSTNNTFSNPGGINFNANGNVALSILNNGNVGIGTITPDAKLHVVGNIHFAGNVGIGTSSPTYKLEVCGVIRANEVRVEIGWCDYVFADDYKLPALSEVEAFIKENKHLPDVTKGSIIESEGLEVGKVSSQMIKKIEELTLYVIELSKKNENLQQQIDKLNSK